MMRRSSDEPEKILVEDAAKDWFKDPEFVAEFAALREEFAIVEASITARDEVDPAKKPSASDP
ncbi:hypothetical protein RFM98_01085 [Mesorhizobium sp. VK9D]|uniref:hypothetical protein n=1 Tax=Mesorhizobium australafricanum TaxID=3072311 RepID=UPI002A248BF9|nr:hypothetical protein [Mesorhizobium sp. VK9D]MDX8451343.1 hypothetical protein [Mesorhizobium sp. VK9D]